MSNSSFTQSGRLVFKGEPDSKTGSFRAREFVIETEGGQYAQLIKFQLVQDRCDLIDEYSIGDMLDVHFDLRGREWQGKYFTNLNAWRIEMNKAATPAPANTVQSAPAPMQPEPGKVSQADDLPF